VSLNVGCETTLRGEVEVDHRVRERFGVASKSWYDFEESPCEGTVDLFERGLSRVVDHDERSVSKESLSEGNSTGIGRRVASSDDLDVLEFDPGLVRGPPESTVFDELAKERDDFLGTVVVRRGEVDLVAEQHEPSTDLNWREDDSVRRLAVLAVLLESFQDEFGSSRAREVESDDVEVW
jgi:hypothetical protein